MALPKKLKDLNLFGNGDNWQGLVDTLTLPTLARKMEEWRGGGMDAPVDIDLGMEKLTFEWTIGGLVPAIFDNFGTNRLDADLLRFEGFYERDDVGQTSAVTVVVRGRHQQIAMGDAKTGDNTAHQITTTCSYYKLEIDGATVIEIDVPGLVFKVNGEDRYAERRKALGL